MSIGKRKAASSKARRMKLHIYRFIVLWEPDTSRVHQDNDQIKHPVRIYCTYLGTGDCNYIRIHYAHRRHSKRSIADSDSSNPQSPGRSPAPLFGRPSLKGWPRCFLLLPADNSPHSDILTPWHILPQEKEW